MTKLNDISAQITAQLIEAIESRDPEDTSPILPWHRTGMMNHLAPRNASTAQHYQGSNIAFLFFSAMAAGFTSSTWATYKQWEALGAQVAKGQTSTLLFRWVISKNDDDKDQAKTADADKRKKRAFPVGFRVFNTEQLVDPDNAPMPDTGLVPIEHDPIPHVEDFYNNLGVSLFEGSDRAFYEPATDTVHVPNHNQFDDIEHSWAVRLHEAAHWTGAAHRLDRDLSHDRSTPEYAQEELVAELAASIACARLGIGNHLRDDHARYLHSWLSALKEDPRYLTSAVDAASKAVRFMDHAQPTNDLEGSPELVGVGG